MIPKPIRKPCARWARLRTFSFRTNEHAQIIGRGLLGKLLLEFLVSQFGLRVKDGIAPESRADSIPIRIDFRRQCRPRSLCRINRIFNRRRISGLGFLPGRSGTGITGPGRNGIGSFVAAAINRWRRLDVLQQHLIFRHIFIFQSSEVTVFFKTCSSPAKRISCSFYRESR